MIILVDTENVQLSIEDVNQLDATNEIIFFTSRNSNYINPFCIGMLERKGVKYSFEMVDYTKAIKNCLDLHLVIYLTHKLSIENGDKDKSYCIYSKDTDFSEVSLYIERLTGIDVKVVSCLEDVPSEKKMDEQRQKEIDQIVLECAQSCANLQQAYRYMVKVMRADYSMSEIADIYASIKEDIAARLNNRYSELPVEKQIVTEESRAIDNNKIENVVIPPKISTSSTQTKSEANNVVNNDSDQPKSKGVSVKLSTKEWNAMKCLLGYLNSNSSAETQISYQGKMVEFSNESIEFNKCTFALSTIDPVKEGQQFELKCAKPKQSKSMKISVTKKNRKQINNFLDIVRKK